MLMHPNCPSCIHVKRDYNKTCKRCLYEWVSMVENPKQCSRCKSAFWFKDRIRINYKSLLPTVAGESVLIPWPAEGSYNGHPTVMRHVKARGFKAEFKASGVLVTWPVAPAVSTTEENAPLTNKEDVI